MATTSLSKHLLQHLRLNTSVSTPPSSRSLDSKPQWRNLNKQEMLDLFIPNASKKGGLNGRTMRYGIVGVQRDAGADELEVGGGKERVESREVPRTGRRRILRWGIACQVGEDGADDSEETGTSPALGRGFEEGVDFEFGEGEVESVDVMQKKGNTKNENTLSRGHYVEELSAIRQNHRRKGK